MLLLLYRVYLRDFNMKLKWGSSLLLMGYLLPGPEVYLKMVFTLSLTTSPLLFFLLKKERKKERNIYCPMGQAALAWRL